MALSSIRRPKSKAPLPKVSGMLHGYFSDLSERKLMACLNRHRYDIEIKVKLRAQTCGASDIGCRLMPLSSGPRPRREAG